ncbi:hypothetical protein [Nocardioides sp. CER19]|uniref:hypothetical protein n=1 Tax=Nocardioides sp. CER19 TaxID=3038538 RepID=UPI00244775A1|nr:hypothetical protein [Nocardioides sp. CER19]MDH2416386.1 hypothetical protein [Nocardioides sp. CER19]
MTSATTQKVRRAAQQRFDHDRLLPGQAAAALLDGATVVVSPLTVLFDEVRYRTLPTELVTEHGLLEKRG